MRPASGPLPRRLGFIAAVLAGSLLAGCSFTQTVDPSDVAAIQGASIPFLRKVEPGIATYDEVRAASKNLVPIDPMPARAPGVVVAEFLQVSDAQIRDELIPDGLQELELSLWDQIINESVRNADVEAYDSLTLAAFVAAFAQDARQAPSGPRPFLVHTGDLLDIGLVTELIEGLNILRSEAERGGPPLYSVTGNHDGLIFGNLPDTDAATLGLGINRSEFVLAHVLADPRGQGFGLVRNEILGVLAGSATTASAPTQLKNIAANLRRIEARRRGPAEQWRAALTCPEELRALIEVDHEADTAGEQVGYYSWSEDRPLPGFRGLRYIALDTRSSFFAAGAISDAQLGWLYRELRAARELRQGVIIFAHHEPDEIVGFSLPLTQTLAGALKLPGALLSALSCFAAKRQALEELISSAPVLAYFYGHGHENRVASLNAKGRSIPLIQTGSLADFPQVGRRLRLSLLPGPRGQTHTATIEWDFVRPRATGALAKALGASLEDARRERDDQLLNILTFKTVGDIESWNRENLPAGARQVILDFGRPMPSPAEVFGEGLLAQIESRRALLGLAPVAEANRGGPPAPKAAASARAGAHPRRQAR